MENTKADSSEDKNQDSPSSSGSENERQDSTSTDANGGTRSSPPRVGGDGRGEAKDVKAKSAERAQSSTDKGGTSGPDA